MSDFCVTCGRVLTISDWPWCPHGTTHFSAIGDDWPGGKVIEHLGHEPITVYSKSELQRLMDAKNVRHPDRWVPGDTQLSNWANGVTSKTLEDAKILLSRGTQTHDEIICETAQFSETPVNIREVLSERGV